MTGRAGGDGKKLGCLSDGLELVEKGSADGRVRSSQLQSKVERFEGIQLREISGSGLT